VEAYVAAGLACGHGRTADYNGKQQEGFGDLQLTIGRGRRSSAATAYLRPALQRPNLSVKVNALAHRVVLQGGRATGVEYSVGNLRQEVTARREVLLCGGAINTPQLLMLSGVGDPSWLREHRIAVHAGLPGVGRNLRDHLVTIASYARATPGTFHRNMRLDRVARALGEAYFLGRGLATDLPSGLMAFLKSDPGEALPDTQLLFHAASMFAGPYLPPFRPAYADGFSCRAVLLRPESRGEVTIASSDPAEPPRIRWNFLSTDRDRKSMRRSFSTMREIGRQAPLRRFISKETAPGVDVKSDSDIDAYIRTSAVTAHHPLGTCRMGPANDAEAVVDSELRVRGVSGLRVIDASVIPEMIGGNINAAVIMIAEKASDLIRGRPPLERADVY
jgi:4-pyridoxate dehydrogenase